MQVSPQETIRERGVRRSEPAGGERNGAGVVWGGVALWMLLLLGAAAVSGAQAQTMRSLDDVQIRELEPAVQMEAARQWIDAGRPAQALPVLRALLRADSAYVSPTHGAASYWLGTALQQLGRTEAARRAWEEGIAALRRPLDAPTEETGRPAARTGAAGEARRSIPPRLASAFLDQLTPETLRGRRLEAVDVYRDLLGAIGPSTGARQDIYRRHVAQLAPMMPDEVLARVIHQERDRAPATWTFRDEAGASLRTWWRSLDPFPATSENERLEEHLQRRTIAQTRYACPERVGGVDDRGLAYLRFGPPNTARPVDFDGAEFFREVYRFGVAVTPADFPDNAFWRYTHIDRSGYYLFTREPGGCYTIGEPNDLLPRHLQHYRGANDRGLNIAYSALMALRYIYRQLALLHPDFGLRYSSIADYADWQETQAAIQRAENATGASMGGSSVQSVTVGAGVGQQRTVSQDPLFGIEAPNQFVPDLVAQAHREDAAAARRRQEEMPRQHTNLLARVESLPLAVRTVRRLQADGRTASRVYWGLRTGNLRPPESEDAPDEAAPSIVSVAATRYDTEHRADRTVRSRHVVPAAAVAEDRPITAPPLDIGASSTPVHLALQWDQSGVTKSGGRMQMGKHLRRTTARADSLMPLRASGTVEMSDLHVLVAPTNEPAAEAFGADGVPYPFDRLAPTTPVRLAFEVYHLTFGADDRTRYEIAYEVEQKVRRGWTRFFRSDDATRTATAAVYRGTSRRTDELIELDLTEFAADRPQDLRITVRVTDEISNRSVERSVDFVLE